MMIFSRLGRRSVRNRRQALHSGIQRFKGYRGSVNIVMFAPGFAPYAASENICNSKLALALVSRGHSVSVISRYDEGLNYGSEWVEPWLPLKSLTHEVHYEMSSKPGRFSRPSMEPPMGDARSYELLLQIIKQRRSVRSFQDRPVDRQILQQVVESANWAPQSCNRQTVRVFAATDSDLVQACARTCRGAICFSGRACFLCFAADLRPYHLPEEMWLPMVDTSLCAENCCLIAHTPGLSLTLLTSCQSDQEEEVQVRHLLGVPWYYRIVVNGLMGYPKGLGETPARKALGPLLSVRLPPQIMKGCDA